jgi:hypothetical protein
MTKYRTLITTQVKGTIESDHIAHILKQELENFMGTDNRYIEDGMIKEHVYHNTIDGKVTKATAKEIELYNAFKLVEDHFRKL